MAGYLKTTCGVLQMVSNGNEGYRVQGAYDPYASTAYPFNVRRLLSQCSAPALGRASLALLSPVIKLHGRRLRCVDTDLQSQTFGCTLSREDCTAIVVSLFWPNMLC